MAGGVNRKKVLSQEVRGTSRCSSELSAAIGWKCYLPVQSIRICLRFHPTDQVLANNAKNAKNNNNDNNNRKVHLDVLIPRSWTVT